MCFTTSEFFPSYRLVSVEYLTSITSIFSDTSVDSLITVAFSFTLLYQPDNLIISHRVITEVVMHSKPV